MVQLPDPFVSNEASRREDISYDLVTGILTEDVQSSLDRAAVTNLPQLWQVMAGVTLVSGLAGLVWGSHLAAQELKVRLEAKVEAALHRPVEWGGLRGLSPAGIRLGKTTIPAGSGHQAAVEIDAIDITFDWRTLLRRQTPEANITLVRPHLSLVQSPEGEWPSILGGALGEDAIAEPKNLGGTLQNLGAIQIESGTVTLATRQQFQRTAGPRSQVNISNINGTVTFTDSEMAQSLELTLHGRVEEGGFTFEGLHTLGQTSFQGKLQAFSLPIRGLNLLLPSRVGIESGVLNSNVILSSAWEPESPFQLSALDLQGTAILNAGTIRLGQLAEPVSNLRSSLWFEGNQITLHNTSLQIGRLSLSTEGTVSLSEGYNLLAQIPSIQAADLQHLLGQDISVPPAGTFQWQARVTGPLREPLVEELTPPPPASWGQIPLNPEGIGLALGMGMASLPLRDRIPLIEGATYEFRSDGAWFTLTDGTIIPPLSRGAFQQATPRLGTTLTPGLDRKLFWLLQSSPYVTAIAADLGRGKLQDYRVGNRFNTDRFFLDYFIPVYREASLAAGLDPGEALWMLDHSLRTLQDPLLRTPDATPITSGAGTVGSFWDHEQALSMQQLILRPQLAQTGQVAKLTRFALIKHLDLSTALTSRRLASTPEVMSKLPNVTFGAEEGAIAQALGIVQFQGPGMYPDELRTLADRIVQNEFEKQGVRSTITEGMQRLTADYAESLGETLAALPPSAWHTLGLPPTLRPAAANHLNGANTLSVLVSRNEKAGYSLTQAYQNSRQLLFELLQVRDSLPQQPRFLFALLKDQAFSPHFWDLMAEQRPALKPEFSALAAETNRYRQLAIQGAELHEQLYALMIQSGQDISVSAAIKQAIGFQAHLAQLIDQAFVPADAADPRYLAFRRSLAIYLREAPDISVYGGTEAALRLYGYETLNVQEMLAVDVAAAPRIRALARLYQTAWQGGMIEQWDVPGFQRILLTGSLLAAGVERDQLPPDLAAVGFPSAEFRRDLLFAVGPEGIKLEGTRLGVQAHDHRVSFQPVAIPAYRAPSFEVANPNACPTQPEIQAIAMGPGTEFIWYPTIQQVVLKRGDRECPIHAHWQTLFFDTLLEKAPVVHSPAGAAALQAKLREAQLLEAGIF